MPFRPSIRIGLLAAIAASLLGTVAASGRGPSDEAPRAVLRIGVPHVVPEPETPAARLYTEDGFEADLARDLGKALGRRVEIRALRAEAVPAALAAGSLDAALTRGGEGIETGYASALSVAMRSDTAVRSWEDLSGRTVCISAGNRAAQALAEASGARLRVEPVPALSLMRVRTGECDAAIHDAALLERLFAEDGWRKFSATLPPVRASSLRLAAVEGERAELSAALAEVNAGKSWGARTARWAANVAFEIYLDQEAPDCH